MRTTARQVPLLKNKTHAVQGHNRLLHSGYRGWSTTTSTDDGPLRRPELLALDTAGRYKSRQQASIERLTGA